MKSTVSQWESGVNPHPPAFAVSVWYVFGASRDYLEKGEGDMFPKADGGPMEALSWQYGLSKADQRVVEAFCQMPPKQKQVVRDFMSALRAEHLWMRQPTLKPDVLQGKRMRMHEMPREAPRRSGSVRKRTGDEGHRRESLRT